jgi:enolase-phosphatase E1
VPSVILLDIEGTTTPIRFVYSVLFPYAREHGPSFLREHWDDPEIQRARAQFETENPSDRHHGAPAVGTQEGLIDYYLWLMDRDRKSTPLKLIQGLTWSAGYANGDLHSEVFADVPDVFRRWTEKQIRIAIYSSGSVLAQRELFQHTAAGDLTPLIEAYFDTNVGPKRAVESYSNIARELRAAPAQILFVSDVIEELDAAKTAGLDTVLSIRPGNAAVSDARGHRSIYSFAELV